MFENFKAYDSDCRPTKDYRDTIYLVILNEKGYDDIINWAEKWDRENEVQHIKDKESYYYRFDVVVGEYYPLDETDVPAILTISSNTCPSKEKESINNFSQKFKIKIQLVNGITIEPNLHSNDFHEIADVIQELSCEKLFAGQIRNIKIV